MAPQNPSNGSHPEGETKFSSAVAQVADKILQPGRVALDVPGPRIHVEWDPAAPVTPLGQLVYFSQFLATGGVYACWIADCPLRYTSPNAPKVGDVLGTLTLAILAGSKRYAHVTALRGDTINAQGLGMSRVLSEDALRRAFAGERRMLLMRSFCCRPGDIHPACPGCPQ